jgi:hypothetical protein
MARGRFPLGRVAAMYPPIAITLTIKVSAPDASADFDAFVEEIRSDVASAIPSALDVEVDDWTTGGGMSW